MGLKLMNLVVPKFLLGSKFTFSLVCLFITAANWVSFIVELIISSRFGVSLIMYCDPIINEPLMPPWFPITEGPALHLSEHSYSSRILSRGEVTLEELAFLLRSSKIMLFTLIGWRIVGVFNY